MSITSIAYLVFLATVIAVFRVLQSGQPASRQALLIAASYLFLGSLHWASLASLLAVTLVAYFGARAVAGSERTGARRRLLGLVLALLLGQWALFNMVPELPVAAIQRLKAMGLDLDPFLATIVVPIGLSFYTFTAIGYLVDVHRERVQRAHNFREVALLLGFFPHVLSGPIGRAEALLPQFRALSAPTRQQTYDGLSLLVQGLAKKILLADLLGALIVDPAFDHTHVQPAGFLLLALYAYTLQIYFDLSGYTDIARGAAKLLGVELMENFNEPYLARSVSQFWTRWHISMSSFFRDYLYFALGGSKAGNVYRNLLFTFLAIGMWHNVGWAFALYGLLHGAAVGLERYGRGHWSQYTKRLPVWAFILATFHFVVFSRLLFRSPDIEAARDYAERILTTDAWYAISQVGWLAALVMGVAAVLAFKGRGIRAALRQRLASAPNLSLAASMVLLALFAVSFQVNQQRFLYFAF